nr:bis(5'-nucleosyl)-tetraphosphatase, symmetrical-like [Nerophis lumbriciformis]
MATYVIGDVHGCFDALARLLDQIALDYDHDDLWLTGDLVNRGPKSLRVLRWARATHQRMGDRFVAVLGNHDLHLLACARGLAKQRAKDTLERVLKAKDRDQLLSWLTSRPLLHRQQKTLLVHAGLLPEWKPKQAEQLARAIEQRLRGDQADPLLSFHPSNPSAELDSETEPLRAALAVMTRLRTLDPQGQPNSYSGPPATAPKGHTPWFEIAGRGSLKAEVICGHWAALGVHLAPGISALDSGAAWGGRLTALRLEDRRLFQVEALETRR